MLGDVTCLKPPNQKPFSSFGLGYPSAIRATGKTMKNGHVSLWKAEGLLSSPLSVSFTHQSLWRTNYFRGKPIGLNRGA